MIAREPHGSGALLLRLERPPVNALDRGLVDALTRELGAAIAGGAPALVLSGTDPMLDGWLDEGAPPAG